MKRGPSITNVDSEMGIKAVRSVITMKITLKLAPSLSAAFGNKEKIVCEIENGSSLFRLMETVSDEYPGFKSQGVYEASKISDHVIIFINGNNARHLNHLDTVLSPEDTVYIIPLMAGG
jgi:molybdopterin converting factor small subunit